MGKRPGNCNSCGEKGHWARECMKKPTDEKDGKWQAWPNRKDDRSNEGASGRTFGGMAFGFMENGKPYGGLAHTFMAAINRSKNRKRYRWVKDCGAMHHMNSDREQFFEFRR